jgi:hypothetical protein
MLMKSTLFILVVAGLLSFMPTAQAADEGISVTSTGTVKAMPDKAEFDVVVQFSDREAGNAAARTADTVSALQKALRTVGIPATDATTLNYSLRPEWSWSSGKNVFKGYIARHVIRVSVSDLRQTGAAVDAAVRSGAGEVGEMRFVSSRYENLRKSALELAVRTARGDAEVMARAAGGRLGSLLELNSDETHAGPVMAEKLMNASAPQTGITPGEQDVSVTVHARWRYAAPSSK